MRLNTNIFLGLAAVLLFFASCELQSTCNECFEVSHEEAVVDPLSGDTIFTDTLTETVCKDNFRLFIPFGLPNGQFTEGTPCAIVGGKYDDCKSYCEQASDLIVTNEIVVCDD